MEWYNEPPDWSVEGQTISVTSGAKTDFWRKTHYGFIRDSGHFYHEQRQGNLTAEVTIHGAYRSLYDQAGLMLRIDETRWIKCGIEFVDGVQQASVVVTNDFSDWSVVSLAQNPACIRLRLTRRSEAVEIFYALEEEPFTLLRMAYLPPVSEISVGVMCASPDGEGFPVRFEGLLIT